MIRITVNNKDEALLCPIRNVIAPLTGKWRPLLVFSLEDGSRRFSEIRRLVGDITQRVLTLNLRQLERDGYLTRRVIERKTIEVHYELTDRGQQAVSFLKPMVTWAADIYSDVKSSRTHFDDRNEFN